MGSLCLLAYGKVIVFKHEGADRLVSRKCLSCFAKLLCKGGLLKADGVMNHVCVCVGGFASRMHTNVSWSEESTA